MNKKIFIVLALASLFIATQAAYVNIVCADSNCATCGSTAAGSCTVCSTGYFLATTTTTSTCTACNTPIAGCATCTSATVCGTAAPGYFIVSGQATACNTPIAGCATCTSATVCGTAAPGYFIVSGQGAACNSPVAGCTTCTSATVCGTAAPGYFIVSGQGAACNSPVAGCTTCTSATVCGTAAAGYFISSGQGILCGDTFNANGCSALDTATGCTKGTLGSGICCGVPNCATCATSAVASTTGANAYCATPATGYYVTASFQTSACTAASNCATCTAALPAACGSCSTGYALSGTANTAGTTCVATTPVPSTSSPSSAFNVTPALVYTTTDTTAPAFTAVSGSPMFGPGADSTSAYVWLLVNPASTTGSTYSVNKRTVNTSGTFAKSNTTADVAISTAVIYGQLADQGSAPGWFWLVSSNCNSGISCYWNSIGGTAVTQEITLNYVAGTGSSMTAKALTGNTNANVFFDIKDSWYKNGTIFVAYVMSTRTTGVTTGSVADTWAANGLYIQGVNVTSGALFYSNNTGGVKALAMTQTASGAATCISAASALSANCVNSYYSSATPNVGNAVSSFTVWAMNWTTTDTVQYGWVDQTSTVAVVYKTGTINCTTGAATSGTALATTAADASTTALTVTTTVGTSYSFLGGLASMGTYGVFISKRVRTMVSSTSTDTSVYTIQGFLNGSSTVNTNFTVASGYMPTSISGFHTADGFVLLEQQYSTVTVSPPAQANLLQAERFFTNGSAYGSAVALGTYQGAPQTYQDTNGSVIVGYTIYDTNTGSKTYSGYMGTYIAQSLSGVSLASIFGLLSFMIVALFAF